MGHENQIKLFNESFFLREYTVFQKKKHTKKQQQKPGYREWDKSPFQMRIIRMRMCAHHVYLPTHTYTYTLHQLCIKFCVRLIQIHKYVCIHKLYL